MKRCNIRPLISHVCQQVWDFSQDELHPLYPYGVKGVHFELDDSFLDPTIVEQLVPGIVCLYQDFGHTPGQIPGVRDGLLEFSFLALRKKPEVADVGKEDMLDFGFALHDVFYQKGEDEEYYDIPNWTPELSQEHRLTPLELDECYVKLGETIPYGSNFAIEQAVVDMVLRIELT